MFEKTILTDNDVKNLHKKIGVQENAMKTVFGEYERNIKKLFGTYSNDELVMAIWQNTSRWSGGHSLRNMEEQIANHTAADILEHRKYADKDKRDGS